MLLFNMTIFFFLCAFLILNFNFPLFNLCRHMPTGFSGKSIIVKFFTLCCTILFPIRMFQIFLCDFKAFWHFILRFLCWTIIVVSYTELIKFYPLTDWWIVHTFRYYSSVIGFSIIICFIRVYKLIIKYLKI